MIKYKKWSQTGEVDTVSSIMQLCVLDGEPLDNKRILATKFLSGYEKTLGLPPAATGYVLTSDLSGNRSWIQMSAGTGGGSITNTEIIQTIGDNVFEKWLSNPPADGYVLTSTMAGVRSWTPMTEILGTTTLTETGVIPGIYHVVNVDKYGRVIEGTNPTDYGEESYLITQWGLSSDATVEPTTARNSQPSVPAGQFLWMRTSKSTSGIWSTWARISGKDGATGADGADIEFVYARNNAATWSGSNPVYSNTDDSGFDNVTFFDSPQGVTADIHYEWYWVRYKEAGNNVAWGQWIGPNVWSQWGVTGMDGDGFGYVFKRTATQTAPTDVIPVTTSNYQNDDFIPTAWGYTDNPQGVTNQLPYEWVRFRKKTFNAEKTGKEWGPFKAASLWGKYVTSEFSPKDAAVKGLDIFHKSKDGVITPDSLVFKATEKNLAGNITYTWSYSETGLNGSWTTPLSGNGTDTFTFSKDLMTKSEIYLKCTITDDDETFVDTEIITLLDDGSDAIVITLDNDTHIIGCTSEGVPLKGELAEAVSNVTVYRGGTALKTGYTAGTAEYTYEVTSSEGITATQEKLNDNIRVKLGVNTITDASKEGYILFTATVPDPVKGGNIVTSKKFTLSKSKNGYSGISSYKSTVFKRSSEDSLTAPVGGTYANPVPTDVTWTDGIPAGTTKLWVSTCIFRSNDDNGLWTTPTWLTSTADFEVWFSSKATMPGVDPFDATWTKTGDETSIWMATRVITDGIAQGWSVTKIKGENGDAAKISRLSTNDVFHQDKAGNITPEYLTLRLNTQNLTNPTYQWQYWNPTTSAWVNFSTNSTSATYNLYPSQLINDELQVQCVVTDDGVQYTDPETIIIVKDGTDTISVSLDNDNHTVSCDTDGNPQDLSLAFTNVKVYKGGELLTNGFNSTTTQYTLTAVSSDVTNMPISSSQVDSTIYKIALTNFKTAISTGYVTITVTPTDSAPIVKKFTLSKSKAGPTGPTSTVPGPQGLQGCIIRQTEWASKIIYRNDENLNVTGQRYIDIVTVTKTDGSGRFTSPAGQNYSIYQAKAAHNTVESSVDNKPGSGALWTTYWLEMENLGPVYTSFLLARKIQASEIETDSIVSKTLKTSASGPRIEIYGSILNVYGNFANPNIRFGINANGQAVLTYYDNNGNKIYDLGPNGFDWGSIIPASWSSTKLTKICNVLSGDTRPTWSDITAKAITSIKDVSDTTGSNYYQYYAGSNPSLTEADRVNEKYLFVSKDVASSKIADGWYSYSTNEQHLQYISNNTYDWIKPDPSAIYEFTPGVKDQDPIYMDQILEYVGGVVTRQIDVYWNELII